MYAIHFTDVTAFNAAKATYPGGYFHNPVAAKSTFSLPGLSALPRVWLGPQAFVVDIGAGIYVSAAPIQPGDGYSINVTRWFSFDPVNNTDTPPPAGWYYNTGTFSNPTQTHYILDLTWMGYFVFDGAVPAQPSGPPALAARRWLDGFELPVPNAQQLAPNSGFCRASSRTTDGFGLQVTSNQNIQHQNNPAAPNTAGPSSWERFYIRWRSYSTTSECIIWTCSTNVEGSRSANLLVNSSGALLFRNQGNGNAYPGVLVGTGPTLALNTWYKIDILLKFSPGPNGSSNPGGTIYIYVNGSLAISSTAVSPGSLATGLGAVGIHVSSTIGTYTTASTGPGAVVNNIYDLDDWMCTDWPANDPSTGIPSTKGADFNNGTHSRLVRPTSFSASQSGYGSAPFQVLAAYPFGTPQLTIPPDLTTTTSGATIGVNTDYVDVGLGGALSLVPQIYPTATPAVAMTFGYKPGTSGQITGTSPLAGSTSIFWGMIFSPASGSLTPALFSTLALLFTRNAATTTVTVPAFLAAAEYAGAWGPEDAPVNALPPGTTFTIPARSGLHNAPYPDNIAVSSPTGVNVTNPQAVYVLTGTYTGNGTGQDISVGQPVHWMWVRPVLGGGQAGHVFWSSCMAAHNWMDDLMSPHDAGAFYPTDGTNTTFRVSGTSQNSNQNGTTYRWVAFCDPQARFCLNGAFTWALSQATASNSLQDGSFTSQGTFFAIEGFTSGAHLYFRGPGHTADRASPLNSSDVAGIATTAAGSITSKAALHQGVGQTAYSAWRDTDAKGITNVVDIVTFTGDGNSSRNVAVNLGGRKPLFSMVVPHNGGSYYRDPSHTGADASGVSTAFSTTAIISHSVPDTVVVGSTLNTNAIVYDVFVIADITGEGTGGPVPPNLAAFCPPVTQATLNFPFSTGVQVIGGVQPYIFLLTSGSLPPGLTGSSLTGLITGTPTAVGTYPFTASVTDAAGTVVNISCTLTVVVGGTGGPLTIACPPSTANIASLYSQTIPATGGFPPYTFSISSGTLPPGLSLNTSTGLISGVPTTLGTYPFTVSVTDSATPTPTTVSATCPSGIVVSPPLGPPGIPSTPPTGACIPCTTLSTAINLLSNRLQDGSNVHWTTTELARYLAEAVRTWQALTSNEKAQATFSTIVNQPFYDLPTQIPSLRGYNLKDTDLLTDMQYSLMEPPTPTAWSGTAQFLLQDLATALEHRRDRFLVETGMVLNRFVSLFTTLPADGRITLDPSIVLVRRIAWLNTATGSTYPLSRDDEWSLQSWNRTWPSQSTLNTASFTPQTRDPLVWSVGVTPPLRVQVAPVLSLPGMLDFIVVQIVGVNGQSSGCFDPINPSGVYVGVPDDWCWILKFGALAEVLSVQGVSYDPRRAAYCEARYRHGISLARAASVVLAARINGQPIQLDGLANFDQFSRGWQRIYGTPVAAALAGCNLIALTPIPTATSHLVTLDVIRNAPIPVAGSDCVGVEGRVLDAILDYAEHLAMFKEGPDELQASMDLLDRFMRVAGVQTSINWASVMNLPAMDNQHRYDERELPRQILAPLDDALAITKAPRGAAGTASTGDVT